MYKSSPRPVRGSRWTYKWFPARSMLSGISIWIHWGFLLALEDWSLFRTVNVTVCLYRNTKFARMNSNKFSCLIGSMQVLNPAASNTIRSHRLSVKSLPCHGRVEGSIPSEIAIYFSKKLVL